MTKVDVIIAGAITEDVIITTPQPTVPPPPLTPDVGLVEIGIVTTTSIWMTGPVPPNVAGHAPGDMYLGTDGSIWEWDGSEWIDTGVNISSSDTPAEVLAKLITVDGAGSGLDADLLDGHHAAFFATDADMTTAENAITSLAGRVTATETVNATQDGQIAANTSGVAANTAKNTAQDGRLDAVEAKNAAQDTSITNINGVNVGQDNRMTTIEGVNTAQDTRMTAIETKNTAQDAAIAAKVSFPEAPSDTNAYGRKALGWVDVTEEAPNDGLGYMRKNGVWQPSTGGATTSDTPPPGPLQNGQLWWESDTGNTYVYFIDPSGPPGQWVQIAGGSGYATCFVGDTPPANPVPTMLWFRTDNGKLYVRYDDGSSAQWVDVTGGNPDLSKVVPKTARAKNRVINGTIAVSQELASAGTTANGGFPADQWGLYFNGLTGISAARSLTTTPDGSPQGLIVGASVAKASLAASDYLFIQQGIEGLRVADFLWGTAAARRVVLRFNFWAATAGTYSAAIRNAAVNRSWVGNFVAPAGWSSQVLSIPGDTTGTWPVTNALGLVLDFSMALGSNYIGVAGWQAGSFLGAPGMSNGVATAQNFWVADVGLHIDIDNTGLAPPWTPLLYDADEIECMRYYQKLTGINVWSYSPGAAIGVNAPIYFKPRMRVTPTCGVVSWGGTSNFNAQAVTWQTEDSGMFGGQGGGTGMAYMIQVVITCNARL